MSHSRASSMEVICAAAPVIAVLITEGLDDALPLTSALVAGGLHVLEVTLRTPVALPAIAKIATELPTACLGVGSVVESEPFVEALRVGARFAVSPGSTPEMQAAADMRPLAWLPGAQTVSDILALRASGYRLMKLFPAGAAGGSAFLRSIAGPIPDLRFCPTGGITAANAAEYLQLPNVACVGGSWLTPAELLEQQRRSEITDLAREALHLRRAKLGVRRRR